MSKRNIPERATCVCRKTCTCTDDEKAERESKREAREKTEREELEKKEMETNFKQAMTDVHKLNRSIDYNIQPNVIYTIINNFIKDFTNKYNNKFNKKIMEKINTLNSYGSIHGLIDKINNIYEIILWNYIMYENKITVKNIQDITDSDRRILAKNLAKKNTRWVNYMTKKRRLKKNYNNNVAAEKKRVK